LTLSSSQVTLWGSGAGSTSSRSSASRASAVGAEKQEPIVTQGSVNDAMHGAEVKLIGGWGDIVRSWERTR